VAEWRVYCKAESAANEREALRRLQSSIGDELRIYQGAASSPKFADAKKYFENAVRYSSAAKGLIGLAREALDGDSGSDVSPTVRDAFVWRQHAKNHYEWGKRVEQHQKDEPDKAPYTPTAPKIELKTASVSFLPGGGLSFSLCDAKPLHRDKRYLNVNIGWGYDTKVENRGQGNRMVLFGASYHGVVSPYLTVGTGAGLATFSSSAQKSAQRLYVQPYIVDFRPGGLRRNVDFHGPWWQVFFFRYSTIIFPAGFEPGQFGGVSPQYRAELVHSVGFHADMAPVIRGIQKRW